MKDILLINASAGSGKTHRLTTLVVEKLRGGVSPEGLMATTFTNKAAAELRERIRLQLLKDDKSSEAQRVFDGFIGTVNSVCARLLSEYAFDAGLSPALDVLPDDDSERLFKIAIAKVIDDYANVIEPAAGRLERIGGGSGYQPLDDWRDDVRTVVEFARANQLGVEELRECAACSWSSLSELFGPTAAGDIGSQLDAAVRTAITELQLILEPKKMTAGALEKLMVFERDRKVSVVPWSAWVRLANAETNKDGAGLLDAVNSIAGDVYKNPEFQEDARKVIYGVFECAGAALEAYETYKRRHGLMDFVDQEALVLALARHNDAFRASMGDRLQQLMVDEFQDTSPIQLALFLELSELAGQSVWVGDPKQSIYGFRGSDPELMAEVTKLLPDSQTLDKSWRSRERLVNFSNAVFSEVFREMGRGKVCLKIPEARKVAAHGGWIESWNLLATNTGDEFSALANGVKNLLEERPDIKPGDIAVLCRKNSQKEEVAKNLVKLGIKASAGQGSLKETRECRLALAALRYMQDRRDTVALAEIVHLSPGHADHKRWLANLMVEKSEAVAGWMNDPLISALDDAREGLKYRTPLEALELAIDRADVMNTLKTWPNSAMRVSNLDTLRGACCGYIDQCRARRAAATVSGFMIYLSEAELSQAEGSGEQTVQVHTYHGAKGLEWPVVILAGLGTQFPERAFGISVVPAPRFDPTDPLANRFINFWPWPFGAQKKCPPELDARLAERQEEIEAKARGKREARRLLYVGMTRARDGMVFAIRKTVTSATTSLKTSWLDDLIDQAGTPLINWPLETGARDINIAGTSVPIEVRQFAAGSGDGARETVEPDTYLIPPVNHALLFPPARLTPSGIIAVDAELAGVQVRHIADLGQRLTIKGQPDMATLGNAVHGFLGADHHGLPADLRLEIAAGLLRRWDMELSINPADLLTACERLQVFIEKTYPGAKTVREWPVTYYNDKLQLVYGWVDMLLELPDGYVVIDHKSYSGADAEEHIKKYMPQLAAYGEAVEKATGKKVMATLVHMPVVAQVFAVEASEVKKVKRHLL